MKLRSPIVILLAVLMILQGALSGLPAFAAGTNLPNVTNYGLYTYVNSNTASPSEISTGNDGTIYTAPPWTKITGVPYVFSNNLVIGIKFAVNVVSDTHWSANQGYLHLSDASGNAVAISVLRSGDGTSGDVNRNYIYLIPQSGLQPSTDYKIIIDSGITANNGQSAGKQQEVDFTTAADTTRPTWSDSKTLTISNVAGTSLTLTWSGATDDAAVTGYNIYANGSLKTSVAGGGTLNCNLTGLSAGNAYNFQVQAVDAARNESTDGPVAGATTTAADANAGVTLDLSSSSLPVKSSVTAGGTAPPNTWVSIKVVGGSSTDPLYYNAVKSDSRGNYSHTFRVPDSAGSLTVVAGYSNNVATAALTATALNEVTAANPTVTVTGDADKHLAITGGSPASVDMTVPAGVTGASISVSDLLATDVSSGRVESSALPALNITAGVTINSAPVQVAVAIPAGTVVSATAGWDGNIELPTIQTASQQLISSATHELNNSSVTINTVIELGCGSMQITFSQPVRIVIPGQAGKSVGYFSNYRPDGVFYVISQITADSADALGTNSEGYINVGSDLVIWTRHFTQFVTYTVPGTSGTVTGGGTTQKITWPSGAEVTVNRAQTEATLTWPAATSSAGSIKEYRIKRSDGVEHTVEGSITTYTDTGLEQGNNTYSWQVTAVDTAGNVSTAITGSIIPGQNPLTFKSAVLTTVSGSNSTSEGSIDGSANVPVRPTIRLEFDRGVNTDAVWENNKSCITMQDSAGANVDLSKYYLSREALDDNKHYIFISPTSDLTAGKTYKIILSKNLKANNGKTLGESNGGQDKVITFTVQSTVTTGGPTINTGSGSVDKSVGATVGLGEEAKVVIPADALKENNTVSVKKVDSPPAAPADDKAASDVYEFTVGSQSTYTFNGNVAITLSFNTTAIGKDEAAVIFYYDESQKKWVSLGGTVTGNTVTVQVNHFTKFAVFAVKKTEVPVVAPGTLTDITGHWAEANIKKLVELGAVSGYEDGTFKPDNTITRAEFATMLVKAFKLDIRNGRVFKDTAEHWAKDYVSTAAVFGIVNGYDVDTFGPDDLITRDQMSVMIVKAAKLELVNEETKFADTGEISEWAKTAAATAVKNGIMKGYPDNTFQPQGSAKRAEAVTVIVNALNLVQATNQKDVKAEAQ